jgi:hypothetical protein
VDALTLETAGGFRQANGQELLGHEHRSSNDPFVGISYFADLEIAGLRHDGSAAGAMGIIPRSYVHLDARAKRACRAHEPNAPEGVDVSAYDHHMTVIRRPAQFNGTIGRSRAFGLLPDEDPMKLMTLALLSAMFSCQATTAAPRPQVYAIASPHAVFSRYSTFSLGLTNPPPAGYEASQRSLEVEHRMRGIVIGALEQRGYVEDNAKPDFVVKFASGTKEVAGESGGYVYASPSVQDSISIDVYDAASMTQVWHGAAFTDGDGSKIDDRLLRLSVQGVLSAFPARSTVTAPAVGSPAEMQPEPVRGVPLDRQ